MDVKSIILATDQGVNMKSNRAKVLHEVLGKALISYPIEAVREIGVKEIGILVGGQKENIKDILGHKEACTFLEESGNVQVKGFVGRSGDVIVLDGDMPLITGADLKELLEFHRRLDYSAAVLSARTGNSEAYGKAYIFKAQALNDVLQEECCLENMIELLRESGCSIGNLVLSEEEHLLKVDSRGQLAQCTQIIKEKINKKHMENGVTIEDPQNTYIGPDVKIGCDTIIEPNCTLKGETIVGCGCVIGCNTKIENSQISNGVKIENSVICESFVDDHANIGPFAYIRPQSKIGKNVKIGDFVEIKNATIGDHTKVSHLTYVGDADVGKHVNFGCGSVLVNYDGVQKCRSIIGDYAFIGCNTNLVSPVTIGERAYTAAGSTITKDVAKESLGIARAKQINKEGWVAYKYPKK